MLTPQELKEIEFDKAMFGGYDSASVDEVFSQVVADYVALTKENAVLKNKLKLLATTIEEYRSVDEAMRKALITAQNMANDMVREAHEKSDELIKNASAVANAKVSDLAAQIREEEKRLAAAKAETAKFVDTMSAAYQAQAEKIAQLRPEVAPEAEESNSLEDTLSLAADEINKCVASAMENMKAFEERAAASQIPTAPEAAAPEAEQPIEKDASAMQDDERELSVFEVDIDKHHDTMDLDDFNFDAAPPKNKEKARDFDFEDLKFGKNYDFDEE